MEQTTLAKAIEQQALSCGYDSCGIIPVDDMDGFKKYYRARVRKVPPAGIFYKIAGDLTGIRRRFPWAKSVIICTFWLGRYRYPEQLKGRYGRAYLLGSQNDVCVAVQRQRRRFETWLEEQGLRWAGGDQYDPISIGPLRYAAVMAGLGIVRKNNFLYTEQGSFVELRGYVIDRACELYHTTDLKPCSEKCNLCQQNCPTGALKGPYTMNPLQCVGYCTTFGKGKRPPFVKDEAFGEWVCGCDACQDACPHNRRHDWSQGEDYPGLEELADHLLPEQLLRESDEFLATRVTNMMEKHLTPSDVKTLRICARRSLHNRNAASSE